MSSVETLTTARDIARAVRQRSVTATEVSQHYLERVRSGDARVGAFLQVEEARVLEQAAAVDRRLEQGDDPGPLAGVPIAVKDNLCTRDLPTTCASAILAGHRPAYDATVVARARAAGGVILGKTNLDEFAMGASTESSSRGVTRNPFDLERVPGGSSGGSAAAVAAGFAPLALGSDTGGSVRQPASFCGVVGLRPTYGSVSRRGLVAFASSLDQVGPLAWNAADAALLLDVIAGFDAGDSTSRATPLEPAPAELTLDGLRVGVPHQYRGEGLHEDVAAVLENTLQRLQEQGARLVELDLPLTEYAVPTYYLIVTSEASSNLARFDGVRYGPRSAATDLTEMYERTRRHGFGDEVKRRIMLGTFALSAGYYDAYYKKALQVRGRLRAEFDGAFQEVDVLLGPTAPTPAFRLGEKNDDPLELYLCDVFTAPSALAGIPGVSVPAGAGETGLPIGLQLLGPAGTDHRLLALASKLQPLLDAPSVPVPLGRRGDS